MKAGASTDDFNKDRYACMQQSQQPRSTAYLDKYGGVANSNIITNDNLFGACMNATGWYFTSVADPKAFNDAASVEVAKLAQLCTQADLQPIFAKKVACKPKDATPEQLGDRSKISAPERVALMNWRSAVQEGSQKIAALERQYFGPTGDLMASQRETSVSATSQLSSQLYDASISWGEFNKGRIDIVRRTEVAQQSLLHN
jgi:hypothetical protein